MRLFIQQNSDFFWGCLKDNKLPNKFSKYEYLWLLAGSTKALGTHLLIQKERFSIIANVKFVSELYCKLLDDKKHRPLNDPQIEIYRDYVSSSVKLAKPFDFQELAKKIKSNDQSHSLTGFLKTFYWLLLYQGDFLITMIDDTPIFSLRRNVIDYGSNTFEVTPLNLNATNSNEYKFKFKFHDELVDFKEGEDDA